MELANDSCATRAERELTRMAGYRYRISLRIWHPTRSLEGMATELNLTPTRLVLAGTPRTTKAGAPLSGVHTENYWTAEIIAGAYADRSLASALRDVLESLTPKRDLLRGLTVDGGRVELFIGWFFEEGNSGDILGHKLLGQLADLCIDISLDIYP